MELLSIRGFIVCGFLAIVEGKVYEKCELARELYNKHNIQRAKVADWVCLADAESTFNSSALGILNWDGSRDHGLFQISELYWCSPGQHNVCQVDCAALRDDDISDDIKCAKVIYKIHGFSAWYGWVIKCKDRDLSQYLAGCGI